ncbi:MAG: hypothetical protein B6242_15980 [Anaerolineaceae bacterium 4572_78]|nr:MAG: hypothetical protein B6242_15980 [Anaerolineaceae bacterium 4572_78]
MTNSTKKPKFIVRVATTEDITDCNQLDSTNQTDYVWQMRFHTDDHSAQIKFDKIRLPRTMTITYPYNPDTIGIMLNSCDYLLVASYQDEIIGFISGMLERWREACVITNLVVHEQTRHKRIGRALLRAMKRIALENTCQQLTTTVQTKNYPAIAFFKKQGFTYCGYNDQYYQNGDIGIIFSLVL